MKVLLINPPHSSIGSRIPREHLPPLGLLSLGGPLLDAGHQVNLLDAEFGPMSLDQIISKTRECRLLHDGAHLALLRDQVETFSKELNDSKSGLLNDYPGECYPGDVMAAIACIRRADAVLGTHHSRFISRPMLGEAAILWLLSIQPEEGFPVRTGGNMPTFVCVVIIGAFLFGIWRMVAAVKAFAATLREPEPAVLAPRLQAFVWMALIVGAIGASCLDRISPGFALLVPRRKKCTTNESAPDGDKDARPQVGRAEV
jgi:hypothetical protein